MEAEKSEHENNNSAITGGGQPAPQFARHALLVSGLTIISRITGLVRDAVLAAALGLSGVSDAFFIGFLIPNLFRRLFGEGALSAAFIPHYSDLLERDQALANRFACVCIALLAVFLAGITLLGEVVLFALYNTSGWSHDSALAIYLAMIMLPYMPLVCLVALAGGMLQVHRKFGPPAAAPVILNLVMIGFALAAVTSVWGTGSPQSIAIVVSIGVLVAGVLQLIWQFAALKGNVHVAASFKETWPTLKSMLIMMGPMILGLAVFQINVLFDSLIAFGLSPKAAGAQYFSILGYHIAYPVQAGAVAALQWSQRLYQFPLGVFGIAVSTAIFPALAAAAGKRIKMTTPDTDKEFARIFHQGLMLTVFIALPASAGLFLVRVPLARVVYEHYAFSLEDALRVSNILMGYAVSVWAYCLVGVVTRAFYAHKNATTPLKISVVMVIFNLALNLILIWPMGAAGLAWSTSITAAIQVTVLLIMVRRYVSVPIDKQVRQSWGRSVVLTALMIGFLLPLLFIWNPVALSSLQSAALLVGMVVIGAGVIIVGGWLTGAKELSWLINRKAS